VKNAVPFLVLCLFALACGQFKADRSGQNVNSGDNAAAEAERSKKYFEIYEKRAELAEVPKKVELTDQPYLAGKVLILKTRKSQPPEVVNPSPVHDKYSPPPPPSDADQLHPVMANSIDEIATVVLVDNELYDDGCSEVDKGLYETEDGKPLLGSVQVCEVTIIDRAKNAVIFKKKFEGKLKERTVASKKRGYVLAKVEPKEIYDFLGSLPRR
jgi:hypothetical protein